MADRLEDGIVVLHFGMPVTANGFYGASLWGEDDQTTSQVQSLAQSFVGGFVWCGGGNGLRVGVGTSNWAINGRGDWWLWGHGSAWATMAAGVHQYASAYGNVGYGAIDYEPSWSTYSKATWPISGYTFTGGAPKYLANNSADGCQQTFNSSNNGCNNGWTDANVYWFARGISLAMAVPQIYTNSGSQAAQWAQISEYGAHNSSGKIVFFSVMTQTGACAQSPPCSGTSNDLHAALSQLNSAANAHGHTYISAILGGTDIRWKTKP